MVLVVYALLRFNNSVADDSYWTAYVEASAAKDKFSDWIQNLSFYEEYGYMAFAHHYSGKLWWRIGWIILVPSLIIYLPFYGVSDDVIGIVGLILTFIQTVVLIGSIFPTEKALKRTFTEEGFRK